MNTSELTSRQSELDSLLKNQDFLHSIPLEQSNLLRREKETLDAYLSVQSAVQAANIQYQSPSKEGIAVEAPPVAQNGPVARPESPARVQEQATPTRATQEQPVAQQKVQQQSKQRAPVKKAVQKKAPAPVFKKVVSKLKK